LVWRWYVTQQGALMTSLGSWVSGKVYRLSEMSDLVLRYAADVRTMRALLHAYGSLAHRERYDDTVDLRLRIGAQVFPLRMRISDIFIIGEILHERQYALQSRLPAAPVILDLGANIGISLLWFLGLHPDARIHAFEPAGDNLRFLEKNIEGLANVTLQRAAVGDTSGSGILHHGEFGGMHSLLIAGEGEEVPLIALDDYLEREEIARVDLLKIDIEGSELQALRGLGPRIRDVQVIVGEVHEAIVNEAEFYGFLAEHRFKVLWKRQFRESREQRVHGFEAVRMS
jgi:FkbM family methyltransferase